jgi:hypothetical protein
MTRKSTSKETGKPRLSPYQERLAWAAQGDFEQLWQLLLRSDLSMIDAGEVFALLLQAIEVRVEQAPDQFAESLHAKMSSLLAYFVLRAEFFVRKRVRAHDRDTIAHAVVRPCDELQGMLTHLFELQRHWAELQQTHANTARLKELARERKLANDRKEKRKGQRRPPRRQAASPASIPTGNGPINRLAGLLG